MNDHHESIRCAIESLPHLCQPIYGHPELYSDPSQSCGDQLEVLIAMYRKMERYLGRPLKVLDLGCAQGFFSFSLSALGASVVGVDRCAENVSVCDLLMRENSDAKAKFFHEPIEAFLPRTAPGEFDLALGFSVFHDLVSERGVGYVRNLIADLCTNLSFGLFELAFKYHPLHLGGPKPAHVRDLLAGAAYVSKIMEFPTHLSEIRRPFYFVSNCCFLLREGIERFDSCFSSPHPSIQDKYKGTRKYYEANGLFYKQYLFHGPHESLNRDEFKKEIDYLNLEADGLPKRPRLVEWRLNDEEASLITERVSGRSLLDLMISNEAIDRKKIIADILLALASLERAGLYHNNVRPWNIILGTDGFAILTDFGSISTSKGDCAWPDDIFFAFLLFLSEIYSGRIRFKPTRVVSLSPLSVSEEVRPFFAGVWGTAHDEWSFSAFYRLWMGRESARAPNVGEGVLYAWMKVVESNLDNLGQIMSASDIPDDVPDDEWIEKNGQSLMRLSHEGTMPEINKSKEGILSALARTSAAMDELSERNSVLESRFLQCEMLLAKIQSRLAHSESRLTYSEELVDAGSMNKVIAINRMQGILERLSDDVAGEG